MAGQMTTADFMKLPEGFLAEIIDGEILKRPATTLPHQGIVGNLICTLSPWVEQRQLGKVFLSPLDVHLPSGDIVEPDLIYISNENRHIVKDWIFGVPELLVEIISPESVERDRTVKRELYARNGVREYWIVDGEAETVEVLTLAGDRYDVHAIGTPGSGATPGHLLPGRPGLSRSDAKANGICCGTIRSPLFPDLALPVGEVLA